MASHFGVTQRFKTIAPNDPEITLHTARLEGLHIYCHSTRESQISFSFTLWPAVFELLVILRQVH